VKLALAQKLHVVEVSELTPLFSEGEESDGAWFLLEGEVSVGRNGKTLANLSPGTMFGLVSAIDQGRRSASCVTTGPARLLKLADRDFDALFASGHRFAFQIVDLIARQLVLHLRQANSMLALPGKASGAAAAKSKSVPAMLGSPAAAPHSPPVDPGFEMIPLDLEIDLDDLELKPAAGLLG
jgi:CRP-like cAMP-binding protein